MNNQIQLVLKSSTTELSLNDRELGIYLTPELDGLTGLPEIRTTSGVNAGYDGGWTSAQNYDARSITIRGVIANEDVATVEQLRRQLTTLAGQGKNEELTLDLVTQAGKAYTIQVRTIALEMSLQKVLTQQEFMLQLRADDPLIYDASETGHEALLQVAQATGGFTIDFELPLAITGSSEETVVNNEGLEQVPTITRMYGALHNPKIINQTTNQFMQIEADLGFAEGDWIEPSEVVSGKDITINGAPEGAPLSSVQIDGNTSQQTYTGKNLINLTGVTSPSGVTGTITDGSTIKVTGTTGTNVSDNRVAVLLPTIPAGTYTFTIDHAANHVINFRVNTSGGEVTFRLAPGETSVTKTLASASTAGQVFWGLLANTTYNETFKLQLVAGSTADYNFEPYVGGTASPNPDYPQAVQTVTGENVVKICGKNLWGAEEHGSINENTGEDVYNANRWRTVGYVPVESNTAYTLSSNAPSDIWYIFCFYDSGKNFISGVAVYGGSQTQTTPANCEFMRCVICDTASIKTTERQLEKGSTASSFEPYQGQSYEVNLGKNLFDKNTATQYRYISDSNGSIAYSSNNYTYAGESYIPCEPNTAYTLSGGSQYMRIAEYASDKTFVKIVNSQASSSPITITTGNTGAFLRVSYNDMSLGNANIQLEKGSKATSYAAYFEPIELCKIGTYQDYIYKSGDKWYVHKETSKANLATDRTSLGKIGSGGGFRGFTVSVNTGANVRTGDGASVIPLFCNMLACTSRNKTYEIGSLNSISAGTVSEYYKDFFFDPAPINDYSVADAETWLNNNPIIVYYQLATPTDTEITNTALIAQLEALAAATMYDPQTNITTLYAEGNEQPTLDVSYFTDKNPDTRDELVIDSRLRTITLNGLDVYHLQAPGSEFLMLAPGENRLALQSDITGDNGYAQVSYKQGYLSI